MAYQDRLSASVILVPWSILQTTIWESTFSYITLEFVKVFFCCWLELSQANCYGCFSWSLRPVQCLKCSKKHVLSQSWILSQSLAKKKKNPNYSSLHEYAHGIINQVNGWNYVFFSCFYNFIKTALWIILGIVTPYRFALVVYTWREGSLMEGKKEGKAVTKVKNI